MRSSDKLHGMTPLLRKFARSRCLQRVSLLAWLLLVIASWAPVPLAPANTVMHAGHAAMHMLSDAKDCCPHGFDTSHHAGQCTCAAMSHGVNLLSASPAAPSNILPRTAIYAVHHAWGIPSPGIAPPWRPPTA